MVKKVLVALLSATMVVGLMAGCGSSAASEAPAAEEAVEEAAEEAADEAEEAVEEAAEDVEEAADEAEEAEAEPEAEDASGDADYSAVKVGAIVGVTIDDGGFCQANYEGLKDAMEALGIPTDEDHLVTAELVAADPVSTESAAEEMMDVGCNILFFISTSYAPITEELAPKYPDVQFCQTGVPQENVLTYHYRAYESPYALGYLCALMSETNELGYIGGMSEASVREGANGFALGAKAANPDATVQLLWVDSWYDPAKEGECANTLIASDVKYIGTGTSSSGAPQACADKGAYCTCFDMDHTDFAPDAVLASMVFDWSPIYKDILTDYVANGMTPFVGNYFYGAAEGCSKLAFNDDLVSADIQAEVQEVLDKIGTGEIDIYGGELKDNQGNVLVADGETMDDLDICNQNFLVENVIGSM